MAKKAIVLIDGGYLRVLTRKAGKKYDPPFIAKFAAKCIVPNDEEIFRILYYDCAPYEGTVKLPISGNSYTFSSSSKWLDELAGYDLFAVRLGALKFRGYRPKQIPVNPGALTDTDFEPVFEQKGVDMRIGIDIASYAKERCIDRVVLVSGDTDCVPAMKLARKSGLQVVIAELPQAKLAPELIRHSDFKRGVPWP